MKDRFRNKSIESAVVALECYDNVILREVSQEFLEKEREDQKTQRYYYKAWFSKGLLGKAVARMFWQDHDGDVITGEHCIWKNSIDPEVLRKLKGTQLNVRIITIHLQNKYVIEKVGQDPVETDKYSFVLMEDEDLEKEIETILLDKGIITKQSEEQLN